MRHSRRSVWRWALLAAGLCGVTGAWAAPRTSSPASAWESSIAPWQNLSVDFDSAIHMGRILGVTFAGSALPVEGALFLMASDNGGLSRSLDGGNTWENVIGGRGFSSDLCGGYLGGEVPGCKSLPQATLYGGPPGCVVHGNGHR